MRTYLAASVLALAPIPHALAWGDVGHRIVCEIAFQEASPGTRDRITALMASNGETGPYSETCLFADHPRTRDVEHYVNLPRDASSIGTDPCPLATKCIVSAIESDAKVLGDASQPDATRLTALKYLGHWVGDVHQPMHVSFADDRGGNSINTTGACSGKLHAAWDSCLLAEAVGNDVPVAVANLTRDVTLADKAAWIASEPVDWANESFAIATAPATAYCVEGGGVCAYQAGNEQLDPGEPTKTVVIDAAYMVASTPVIQGQLQRAGVRLAHLLEEALAP